MQLDRSTASLEPKLVGHHVHAPAAKTHPFSFQSQSLFNGRIAAQLDLTAGA